MAATAPPTALLVLAAGRGTRLRSRLPKVLHPAGGRGLLAHVLAAARAAGFAPADTLVVAGYGAEQVEASLPPGVRMIVQSPQRGTGHAVQAAAPALGSYAQVLVVHGDMPLLSAATLIGLQAALGAPASPAGPDAVLATATPAVSRAYGRVLRSAQNPERVEGIIEVGQATPEQLRIPELNAGFYAFRCTPLIRALAQLGTDNPHGEFYLTDAIAILARGAAPEQANVRAYPLADAEEILGVNDRRELAEVDRLLRRRKNLQLMAQGVTIYTPETVAADAEVTAGEDTVLEPGVQLRGQTRIGANCRIGAYSVLTDCLLADDVVVLPHCVLEGATVGAAARVGPFTRLREQAEIAPGAHLGNFVEVKKSRVGAGAKAMHLAYLGDAQIGARVNIGAGTITCNYDGERKHATVVGDDAFIGSNSTLVAPVTIAAEAYVGAGSVITEAVPEGALALGRGRQVNKPGWVAARQKKRRQAPPGSGGA